MTLRLQKSVKNSRQWISACDAIIMYANRHAEMLEKLAAKEQNETRRKELH